MERTWEQPRTSFLDRPLLTRVAWNGEMVLYAVLALLSIATRFWDLGFRALHHDESMHAYYAWELYRGQGFIHNPLLHGPFQFEITALVYFLLGDSDCTARVAPALFGVALVILPSFLRSWMGRTGALATAAFFAISPVFLYYSRFMREDIFSAFWELTLFVALLAYVGRGRDRYLYLAVLALSLLYSTKEVSFILTFIFGSFLWLALAWRAWGRTQTQALGSILLLPLLPFFELARRLSGGQRGGLTEVDVRLQDLTLALGTLAFPLASALVITLLGGDPLDYRSQGLIGSAIVVFVMIALASGVGALWDGRRWAICAALFYGVFFLLHTTFLTNLAGIGSGLVGSLGYWLAQQGVGRGNQPWYYYFALLSLYEFLPLSLALLGAARAWRGQVKPTLVSDSGTGPIEGSQAEDPGMFTRRLLIPFLAYWTVGNLAIYSWAGEKMPWLSLHVALPIVLWGGHTLGVLIEETDWTSLREGRAWWPALLGLIGTLVLIASFSVVPSLGSATVDGLNRSVRWLGYLAALALIAYLAWPTLRRLGLRLSARLALFLLLGLLALFTVRYAFIASYEHGDVAEDMLIYTQTTPDVTAIMREIESLSERMVGGQDMPIAFDDFTSWPLWWYLRHFPNKIYVGNQLNEVPSAPVVLVGLENEELFRPYLTDYIRQQYRLRWWFPEDYRDADLENLWGLDFLNRLGGVLDRIAQSLLDPQRRASLGRFLIYRELDNPLGSSDFALYLRRDVAGRLWRSSAVPLTPEIALRDAYAEARIARVSLIGWGQLGSEPGQLNAPKGLAVDAQGNLHVVDSLNHRVQVFSAEGELLGSWGKQGSGPGEFQEPWGIAVGTDGRVYVADTWNHRIQVFDAQGRFVAQWGVFGDSGGLASGFPGVFFGPRDIAIDAQGNLYVADTGNKRIQKFDSRGLFLGQWGGEGSSPGQFREPVGLAIDPRGRIYVADTWNRRIQVFDANFNFLTQWPIQGWNSESVVNKPYLDVDEQGRIYLSDPEGYRILVFDESGNIIASFGRYGNERSSFDLPTGVAVDGQGYLYVSDSGNHRVVKFVPLSI